MLNEALGAAMPVHRRNQTRVVNVVDVEIEIKAVPGSACMAQETPGNEVSAGKKCLKIR